MKTGVANLPLHSGSAPKWLFKRMVKLSREIALFICQNYSPETFLTRLSHPYWFSSLGCILGFDWHSSGVTTTVCAALKKALQSFEKETNILIAGGKGATSRKTPLEIENYSQKYSFDSKPLIYSSKMSAKIDNTALQDGFQLYHHTFFMAKNKSKISWAVIQQGMNKNTKLARRYHWLSKPSLNFTCQPHNAIACDFKTNPLNMVHPESQNCQKASVYISHQKPTKTLNQLAKIKALSFPSRHFINSQDFNSKYLNKILNIAYQKKPKNYQSLLTIKGIGPKTIRAISLIADLIYGAKPSFKDPVSFSFAHGGKDNTPYPVDKKTYDQSIEILKKAVNKSSLSFTQKRYLIGKIAS